MNKPNSKRNLDLAIRRMGNGDTDYLRNRTIIANAVIGQMLPNAVIKGGTLRKHRHVTRKGNLREAFRL